MLVIQSTLDASWPSRGQGKAVAVDVFRWGKWRSNDHADSTSARVYGWICAAQCCPQSEVTVRAQRWGVILGQEAARQIAAIRSENVIHTLPSTPKPVGLAWLQELLGGERALVRTTPRTYPHRRGSRLGLGPGH